MVRVKSWQRMNSTVLRHTPEICMQRRIKLVLFDADFEWESIAHKTIENGGDLTEIQGKHCASMQRDRPIKKSAKFRKKPAAPYVLQLAVKTEQQNASLMHRH